MFANFEKYPNIITTVSRKKDGPMKFSPENRQRFLGKLGIDDKLTVRADLVHKDNVRIVSNEEAGKIIEKTDGLITADKNLFLTITVADCLPIFIYDPEKEIVGLIHGGWRSLAKNILAQTIERMTGNFGTLPKDILVGIGPGISQCHFEIKKDLLVEFESLWSCQNSDDRQNFGRTLLTRILLEKEGKSFLDLKKIAKIQLINSGVKEKNIEISPECTFCLSSKYFSHRRDKFKEIKTMMAVIGRE